MIVVADTSPINYLILIGQVHVLPALFGRVIVPRAVIAELGNHHAATAVRDFASDPPPWLEIAVPNAPVAAPGIDPGESEAIAVALEFGADSLIIDDRRGREEAKRRGLAVAGTLSVISDAAGAGLLDFDAAITALLESNFRVSVEVLSAIRRMRAR